MAAEVHVTSDAAIGQLIPENDMLLRKPAFQSSTWTHNNNGDPVPGIAGHANDGSGWTDYDKNPRHCSHTDN